MNFHIKALSIATTVVIWYIVAVTIIAENFAPLKNALAAATGHHWVSKGVFALILFAVAYGACVFLLTDSRENPKPVYVVIGSAIAGGLAIFLFYVWHFFA